MSTPTEEMRLRHLLEQALATGNAAITERDRLAAINAKLLEALESIQDDMRQHPAFFGKDTSDFDIDEF